MRILKLYLAGNLNTFSHKGVNKYVFLLKFQTPCNFPSQVLGSKPGSNKWEVSSLPWSCIIPNEILSELIVVGSASLCRRKRRSRNSTRASSKLGPGTQLSSIPLWWSQWETVLTLPGSRACYVFWLLGRQGVLQCGGKSHVIIMEMLQSLGCETQMARDFSQSPSKQTFLILAQSVVSVFSLS